MSNDVVTRLIKASSTVYLPTGHLGAMRISELLTEAAKAIEDLRAAHGEAFTFKEQYHEQWMLAEEAVQDAERKFPEIWAEGANWAYTEVTGENSDLFLTDGDNPYEKES